MSMNWLKNINSTMAKIINRPRAFSPYSYNVQYVAPGKGPLQKARKHIPTASMLSEFAVSKANPNWFVYTQSELQYSLADDEKLILDYGTTVYSVVPKDLQKSTDEHIEIIEEALPVDSFKIDLREQIWITQDRVLVKALLPDDFDLIILEDGKKHLKFTIRRAAKDRAEIDFIDVPSQTSTLEAFGYAISDKTFPSVEFREDSMRYDKLNNAIVISTDVNTADYKLIAYNEEGKAFDAKHTFTPNAVLIDASYVPAICLEDELQKKEELEEEIESFLGEAPSELLYEENERFRELVDSLQEIEARIEQCNGQEMHFGLSKVLLYKIPYCKTYVLQQGISMADVGWNGDEVKILHRLYSHVNFELNGLVENGADCSAEEESLDILKLKFSKELPFACVLTVFRTQEEKIR